MKLNLSSICECLSPHFSAAKLIENDKEKLYSLPKLATKNTDFNSDTLYIAEYKNLPDSLWKMSDIAVICIGEGPISDTTKCSVLQMKDSVSVVELYSAIVDIYRKYNEWENELLKVIGYHGDLKKAFHISKELFEGNQLNCTNLNGELLAGDINISFNKRFLDNNSKHIPLFVLSQNVDHTKPTLLKGVAQYKSSYVNSHKYHYIQRSLYMKDKSIATVNCTDIDHPLKEIEYLLLNKLCDLLEEGLSEGCIWNDNSITETGLLFQKLLDGEPMKTNLILSQFQKLNIPPNSHFTCLCLRILDSGSSLILLKFLKANIQYYLSNAFVTNTETDIVIFIYTPDKSFIYNTVDEFKKLLNGCVYQIGVSNPFCDIENSKLYYLQASAAIEAQENVDATVNIHYFDDSVLTYIIKQATLNLPVKQVCHPGIIRLQKVDDTSKTSFINTLKTYFDNDQNAIKAAEDLFIHRSTLLYRLDRIRKIIDDDWDTFEKRLYIMLSLKMLEESDMI